MNARTSLQRPAVILTLPALHMYMSARSNSVYQRSACASQRSTSVYQLFKLLVYFFMLLVHVLRLSQDQATFDTDDCFYLFRHAAAIIARNNQANGSCNILCKRSNVVQCLEAVRVIAVSTITTNL
jgi:hypothetical protein